MAINNRYDFVMIFDVENGNPNGDPDAGNTPRIDVETGKGYITDVCLKRKIRNYVELISKSEEFKKDDVKYEGKEFDIFIKNDRYLNDKIKDAVDEAESKKKNDNKKKDKSETNREIHEFMCRKYYDIRMFGAVVNTGGFNAGSIRGPVQIGFSKSISPINIQDITITRQAFTDDKEKKSAENTEIGETKSEKSNTMMGKKSFIPYGLYRAEGYVSAALANKVTDLTEADIELLWKAIINMFEDDHSAARGKMCMRKLIVFKHDNVLGNCPSHLLFDKVKIEEKSAVPRSIDDYEITVDKEMPEGVELIEKL